MEDNKQNVMMFNESDMYGEQLLEALPFGVLAYTVPDMRLLCANRELCRLFEIDDIAEKADIKKNIMCRVLKEDAPMLDEVEAALVNVGDETSFIFRVKRNDGDVVCLECVARLLAFEDGTRYVASSLTNITARAEMSSKLYLERQQFCGKEERERSLQDALAQAEHANMAKSVFLNSMSHNIRVPMNSIIGYTAIASAHVDDRERLLDCLEKIQVSGTHMLSLIDDVLDMNRIEAGKLEIIEEETSLSRFVHNIKNIMLADIRAKQLELVFDAVDIRDEYVWCDEKRLNQAIYNCIGNAIKFTPAGGMVSVKVTQVPCSKEGYATYEFKIQDTGIGISAEFVDHVFEPFERENTPNVKKIQGSGLGLSISKNIVDWMGGTISVESEKGKGTEVTVSFTFRLVSGKEQGVTVPQLEGVRALVVDCNLEASASVVDMLNRMGLRPEQEAYGRDAVLRIKKAVQDKDAFGVYIVDSLIQDVSGREIIRCIHEEQGDDAPIVIMTAYDWEEIEDHADEHSGITAFCTKPLFLSDLCTTLEKAAKKSEDKDTEEMQYIDNMKILLVEDNEMNLEITKEVLVENGAIVDVARNGIEAVQMMEKSPGGYYDTVLMDIQMPIMDGYEATYKIRALGDDYHATVPIIAFSANVFEDDKQKAIESGMNAHISKPIRVDALLKTINEIMRKDNKTGNNEKSLLY